MINTQASLLERVRNGNNWDRFADLYEPLIRRWVSHLGLQPNDVDDIVQDVYLGLLDALPKFEYDPRKGLFRSWLKTIVSNRIVAYCRRKKPMPIGGGDGELAKMIEAIPDPHSGISKIWIDEHDRYILARCIETVRPEFEPQTWRAFTLVAQEGVKPDEAAKQLGMNRGAVYTAKSRVLARLREEMKGLVEIDGPIGSQESS